MSLEFTLIIGNMTRSGFQNKWCPFRRNLFARSSAQVVSAKLGSAPTQQTGRTSIIAAGFTTLVITSNFGSAMAILRNTFGI